MGERVEGGREKKGTGEKGDRFKILDMSVLRDKAEY